VTDSDLSASSGAINLHHPQPPMNVTSGQIERTLIGFYLLTARHEQCLSNRGLVITMMRYNFYVNEKRGEAETSQILQGQPF
jgi:hypothetical protein